MEAQDDDRINVLVQWATQHGAVLHPLVEVYSDPVTGFSFRVKPHVSDIIPPFEPILNLPTKLALSCRNAILDTVSPQNPKHPFPAVLIDLLPPHVVGRLFLIREFLKAEESFWWPYIQSLPQPADTGAWALPPFWPSHEAELLEGTNVEVGVAKIRIDLKKEVQDVQKLLGTQEATDPLLCAGFSPAMYQWAYCIFSSRSFRSSLVLSEEQLQDSMQIEENGQVNDKFSVILPLFDIGNHNMMTKTQWDLRSDTQSCELKIGKEHRPGEQIFNNYSMKTNAELLLGYGFLIPPTDELHNDYTHVRKRAGSLAASEEYLVSLRPLSDPSSVLGRSRETSGFVDMVPIIGAFQHVPPEMVWDIFCTLAQPNERQVLIPAPEAMDEIVAEQYRQQVFLAGKVMGECIAYLEQTIAIIQHKILQELERLNETDVEVVGDGELDKNVKLALVYRERCREVLENTLESIGAEIILEDDEGEPTRRLDDQEGIR